MGRARRVDHATDRADLRQDLGQERLTAEARVDAHDEDEVDRVEDVANGRFVGRGIEHDARALADVADVLERPVEVRTRLDVHRDPIGARGGEVLEVAVGLDDHEVDVDRKRRRGPDRLDDGRPDRDVGDEAPVHDIDVNPVGACRLRSAHLLGESPEIGR